MKAIGALIMSMAMLLPLGAEAKSPVSPLGGDEAPEEYRSVPLTPGLLESRIEKDGRIAIYDIHFVAGSDAVDPASEPALKTIADFIRSHPDRNFYLVGHTDDTGGLQANLVLSGRRAASVAFALISRYEIPVRRLATAGVGPYAPVVSNASEAGRRLNRRVELVLRHTGSAGAAR